MRPRRKARFSLTGAYPRLSPHCVVDARPRPLHIANMLIRSAKKIPLSIAFLLAFLVFLGWRLSQATSYREQLPSSPPPPSAPVEPEQKPHVEERKPLRVAIMTFVTEQRSYLHLSLKNKDRKNEPMIV